MEPIFRERQRFTQWWLWALVLFSAALLWIAFLQQVVAGEPFGTQPASDATVMLLFVVLGVALPVGFGLLRLETRVEPGRLRVRFPPFRAREVPTTQMREVRVVEYRPLVEYGGWGYRRTLRGAVAFIVRGTTGVRITLGDGRHLLVGSQRADELAAALHAAGAPRDDVGGDGGNQRSSPGSSP